ncbi:hypothetical protein, partial [Coprobacter fastidiosus]|uniref:hypothetical protein n=1 Tax=Coprobacter fastidiosus TaxID=1099853 RepID=UPI0026657FCB
RPNGYSRFGRPILEMFEIKKQRLRQYSQTSVKIMNFVQTNPDFPSEKRILSKQTAPFEAVKHCCPNKLNPRQSN